MSVGGTYNSETGVVDGAKTLATTDDIVSASGGERVYRISGDQSKGSGGSGSDHSASVDIESFDPSSEYITIHLKSNTSYSTGEQYFLPIQPLFNNNDVSNVMLVNKTTPTSGIYSGQVFQNYGSFTLSVTESSAAIAYNYMTDSYGDRTILGTSSSPMVSYIYCGS